MKQNCYLHSGHFHTCEIILERNKLQGKPTSVNFEVYSITKLFRKCENAQCGLKEWVVSYSATQFVLNFSFTR